MPEATTNDDAETAATATSDALTNLTMTRVPALTPSRDLDDDLINHPPHYGGEDDRYEAIKIIEAKDLTFHTGNVVKYILRAGRKPGTTYVEDLKKAAWYLQREIERCE